MKNHKILHYFDHDGKHRILLVLDEPELKYDIANAAFIHGEAARVHDNYGHDLLDNSKEQAMHQWKDVCEDGNYDRVKRVIDQSINEIERMLMKYTAHRVFRDQSVDNIAHERKEWVIELRVPHDFSDSIAWELLGLANEYIIDSVLDDWSGMTFVEANSFWATKKMSCGERIRTAARVTGTQYKIKPSII